MAAQTLGQDDDYAIVSCGTLRPELNALAKKGFMETDRLFFTAPGLHEQPHELDEQLARQLTRAGAVAPKIIVLYGNKCYVDTTDPTRSIQTLIEEHGDNVTHVNADNCIDMLAGPEEREEIAAGQRVYWLTPGWLRHWRYIFREWDTGKANETFPQCEKAIMLDAVGFFEGYVQEHPDELLEFSDWMKIPIEPHPVSLDRLQGLLLEQYEKNQ